MHVSPVLLLHICSGTLGVISGYVAVCFGKGSRAHSGVGKIFVGSMLSLGATGAYMAVLKFQPGNILGGALTFYFVATAWMAARRKDGRTPVFDWLALAVIFAVSTVEFVLGVQAAFSASGMRYGYPPAPYFIFGSVGWIAVIGDVRLLWRRGIFGPQRIARHLWRMCFAFFVGTASIFLARPHLFPVFMRKSGMLVVLTFAPLALMIFWLIRVLATKRWNAVNVLRWRKRGRGERQGESMAHA